MQKVCDIGCKFNHLHLHAGTRVVLSCKSKQFILREVEAVVYPQDLSYLIAGKDLTGEVSSNFLLKFTNCR